MNPGNPQLPLAIGLREDASFARFLPGANEALLPMLGDLAAGRAGGLHMLVWGAARCGRTHLLQATCRAAREAGRDCLYVPLDGSLEVAPALLEDLGQLPLVVLDDVDRVLAVPGWPEALFRLFNEVHDAGGSLLLSAGAPPRQLDVALADLATRLSRCVVMEVQALDGDAALELFCRRATERGLEITDEVRGFLERRAPRAVPELLDLLDRLDRAALAAQRRLTVPFVKQTFGW